MEMPEEEGLCQQTSDPGTTEERHQKRIQKWTLKFLRVIYGASFGKSTGM